MSDQIVIEDNKEDILPSATSNFKMESSSKPKKKITQKKVAKPLKAKIAKIMKKRRSAKKDCQDEKQTLQSMLNQIPLMQSLCENHENKRITMKLLVHITPIKKKCKNQKDTRLRTRAF